MLVANLTPMKELISKLREENVILKKQVDINPLYLERHAKVLELQQTITLLKSQFHQNGTPKDSSLLHKLDIL